MVVNCSCLLLLLLEMDLRLTTLLSATNTRHPPLPGGRAAKETTDCFSQGERMGQQWYTKTIGSLYRSDHHTIFARDENCIVAMVTVSWFYPEKGKNDMHIAREKRAWKTTILSFLRDPRERCDAYTIQYCVYMGGWSSPNTLIDHAAHQIELHRPRKLAPWLLQPRASSPSPPPSCSCRFAVQPLRR